MNRAVWALLIASAMSTSVMEPAQAQAPRTGGACHPEPTDERDLLSGFECVFCGAGPESGGRAAGPKGISANMATDPLTSVFGKWEAVENSALAISELADLLTRPGQKCSNGVDVPIENADWARFVQGLRDSGMTAYAAAQSKNQDKILDAAAVMSMACANCHDKYREKKLADRCK